MKTSRNHYTIAQHTDGQLQISIPTRKRWGILLFELSALSGLLIGVSYLAGTLLYDGATTTTGQWYMISLWTMLCTIFSVGGFKYAVWQLVGKTVFTVGQDQWIVYYNGYIGATPAVYDARFVRQVRVQDIRRPFYKPIAQPYGIPATVPLGTLQFDYGADTIDVGNELNLAEGHAILDRLRSAGLLTDQQCWPTNDDSRLGLLASLPPRGAS